MRALLLVSLLFYFVGPFAYSIDPIPTYYEEGGHSSKRSYDNEGFSESVDPFSGKLTVQHRDLVIPGEGGFDLSVLRSYRSVGETLGEQSPYGVGWTMGFGRLLRLGTILICYTQSVNASVNPVLEMPDGSRHVLYVVPGTNYFRSQRNHKAECTTDAVGMIITSPDGTRYDMTVKGPAVDNQQAWYPSKITDRNGNTATFAYTLKAQYLQLDSVSTSDGRALNFTYTTLADGRGYLSTVSGAGRGLIYTYESIPNVTNTNHFLLKSVQRPDGTVWRYDYLMVGGSAGSSGLQTLNNWVDKYIVASFDSVKQLFVKPSMEEMIAQEELKKSTQSLVAMSEAPIHKVERRPAQLGGGGGGGGLNLPPPTPSPAQPPLGGGGGGGGLNLPPPTPSPAQPPLGNGGGTGTGGSPVLPTPQPPSPAQPPLGSGGSGTGSPVLPTPQPTTPAQPPLGGGGGGGLNQPPQPPAPGVPPLGNGGEPGTGTATGEFGYNLKQITYPTGALIDITYTKVTFGLGLPDAIAVKNKTSGMSTWTYTYTPSSGVGVNDVTNVSVTGPGITTGITYNHWGYNSASAGNVWAVGNLISKSMANQSEVYTWDKIKISDQPNVRVGKVGNLISDSATYMPILKMKTIYRDGVLYNSNYDLHDDYGNPKRITESSPTGSRTTTLTYFHETNGITKWILGLAKDKTITSQGSTYTVGKTFDGNGNLLNQTTYGIPTNYTYFANGNLKTEQNARNFKTTYDSYKLGTAQLITKPEGVVIKKTVDQAGNVTSVTDGENVTKKYNFDTMNRLATNGTTPAIDLPQRNDVNISFTATTRTVTRGSFQEIATFDGFGRVKAIKRTDTSNGKFRNYTIQYDALGRKSFVSLPNSTLGYSYKYDSLGRTILIMNPDNSTVQFAYTGTEVIVTDERNYKTKKVYRSYGNPDETYLLETTPNNSDAHKTVITRNGVNHITNVFQNGVNRAYGLDSKQFLRTLTEPEIGVVNFDRDEVGNMIGRWVGTSGPKTSYGYDGLDRLKTITYTDPNTSNVTKEYYKDNLIKSVTNASAVRSYIYDLNKTLQKETLVVPGFNSVSMTYSYDGNDNLSVAQYPSGQNVTYTPNAFGQETKASPFVTSATFSDNNVLTNATYSNGDIFSGSLSTNNRMWPGSYKYTNSAGTVLNDVIPSYDNMGSPLSITDAANANTNRTGIEYDFLEQLKKAGGTTAWNFDYDPSGNTKTYQSGSSAYTFEYSNNRLDKITGSAASTYTYDLNGNMTSNGVSAYRFNEASQMDCWDCGKTTQTFYYYDGDGQRVSMKNSAMQMMFFYSQGKLAHEQQVATSQNNYYKEYYYLDKRQVAQRAWAGTVNAAVGGDWTNVIAKDFNGDGKADLFWRRLDGVNYLWLMNGATATNKPISTADQNYNLEGSGDFNGDGIPDLLWRHKSTGYVVIWTMASGGTVAGSAGIGTVSADWKIVGVGDLDNDKKADIFWRKTDGSNVVWLMNGYTRKMDVTLPTQVVDYSAAAVNDFDGDGVADILWRHNLNGSTTFWLMNANGTIKTSAASTTIMTPMWSDIKTADFDGDGKADIIWRSLMGTNMIWLMDGATVKATLTPPAIMPENKILAVSDFDGDKIADILWLNTITSSYSFWMMNSNGTIKNSTPTLATPPISISYVHTDYLGSLISGSDSTGLLLWRQSYSPWGARYATVMSNSNTWYAGAFQDPSGLIYMGARYYDPRIGRFLSLDPAHFNEKDPRTFNRYTYSFNNSYKYHDTDGRNPFAILDWYDFAKDVGSLLVNEMVYGAAVITGDTGVQAMAIDAIGEGWVDAAISSSGVVNPVPGTGRAIKAARKAGTAAQKAAETAQKAKRTTPYDENQQVVIELAKNAKNRRGISKEEAETLQQWAREYDLPTHGPEVHPGWNYQEPHIHIDNVHHIEIKDMDIKDVNITNPY